MKLNSLGRKSTYVDLVLIQDTSGSFEDTIGNVKEALNDIIDGLNMDTDIDGVSPRDRVMLVRFQGSEGAVQGNSSFDGNASISNQNDYYLVESSSLFTDKTAAKGAIANITDINGGTQQLTVWQKPKRHMKTKLAEIRNITKRISSWRCCAAGSFLCWLRTEWQIVQHIII